MNNSLAEIRKEILYLCMNNCIQFRKYLHELQENKIDVHKLLEEDYMPSASKIDDLKIVIIDEDDHCTFQLINIACILKCSNSIDALLSFKVNVNVRDPSGRIPLSRCILNSMEEYALKLCDLTNDLEELDNGGETPLLLAVRFGLVKVAKKLIIEKKCKLENICDDGFNIRDWLYSNNLYELIPLIREAKLDTKLDVKFMSLVTGNYDIFEKIYVAARDSYENLNEVMSSDYKTYKMLSCEKRYKIIKHIIKCINESKIYYNKNYVNCYIAPMKNNFLTLSEKCSIIMLLKEGHVDINYHRSGNNSPLSELLCSTSKIFTEGTPAEISSRRITLFNHLVKCGAQPFLKLYEGNAKYNMYELSIKHNMPIEIKKKLKRMNYAIPLLLCISSKTSKINSVFNKYKNISAKRNITEHILTFL